MTCLSPFLQEKPQQQATHQRTHLLVVISIGYALKGAIEGSTVLLFTHAVLRSLPDLASQVSVLMCCLLPIQPFIRITFQDDKQEIYSLTQFRVTEHLLQKSISTSFHKHASKQTHFATVPATSELLTSGWSSLRPHNGICADSLELLHKCHFLSYPKGSGADRVLQGRKDDNAFLIHAFTELIILQQVPKRCT